ncbi:MAG TPA: HupE/UreJ family protein [Longimicrobiales bacterium]
MRSRFPLIAGIAATLLMALPQSVVAHEVPASVTVQAFVRPEPHRVLLLVRVPLQSMRDIEIPVRGPGYLDVAAVEPLLAEAARLWIAGYVTLFEEGRALPAGTVRAARVSLPSDRAFTSHAAALDHFAAPRLDPATDLPWEQALLDVMLEFPAVRATADLAIEPAFAHLGLRTATVLRFIPPGGVERVYTWTGNPGVVRLDPRWHHAALHFVELGFRHILAGLDHLLFLLCLIIPFRRLRPLLVIVTSFTVAHSITLLASALGATPDTLWFPPLIETLIALSIVWMAFENIVGPKLERRWAIAFAFGLVHGFGFSFALRESLQFAGSHVTTSLLAFNLGVELGQIAVLLAALPVLAWLFRRVVAERIGTILLSALVAHSAWHWMTERGGALMQYDVTLPPLDTAFAAAVLRAIMLALIAGAGLWALRGMRRRIYASRSTDIGSTRAARHAGSEHATRSAPPSSSDDAPSVAVSYGETP